MLTKIMTVTSAKTRNILKRRPKISFTGLWLKEIGFEYDNLVTVTHEDGNLVFKAHESGTKTYIKLVKGVLKNKSGLLQVCSRGLRDKQIPHFEIKGQWLEDLGFTIGSVIAVQYQQGIINVRLIDLDQVAMGSTRDCSGLD